MSLTGKLEPRRSLPFLREGGKGSCWRTPPNILWICTDQQRSDTLCCYGNPSVKTPNLDRLAGSGVLFENAYCQSPVCTPSRASFLTGRYPRTTRCRQNGQDIPNDEVLVTKTLTDAGYLCGLSGKLHVSACHPSVSPTLERRIEDGYVEFYWSHHPAATGAVDNWLSNGHNLWLREQQVDYTKAPFEGSSYVQAGAPSEYHQTTWCAERAVAFIEANASYDRPWLFLVNFFDPHHPFDPPEAYLRPYLERLEEIPLPNYLPGELEAKPEFQRIDHGGAYGGSPHYPFDKMTAEDHRLLRAAYWAMCDQIDAQVGRILAALEGSGQLENTLVIFMSDHGEMLGDHSIYLKGPYFYDPAVRVPLILSWPNVITPGQRSRALVELVDLAPTLLEAAGLPQAPRMQGRSLWPLLVGECAPDAHRDDVYCEYYNAMPWHKDPAAQATAVRTQRYKLVVVHGQNTGELYDLESDPAETHNRWHDTALGAVKAELLQLLCDRMAWTVDPMPQCKTDW